MSETISSVSSSHDSENNEDGVKLYRRRWFILFLFSFYSATNAFQWIHYSIIANIIQRFYGVSTMAVDWLSMVFMLAYIPLILPVTWLLDRKGLRLIAILGSSLNALGALVKIASADPSLFAVTMLGQTICSIAQVFILGMPSKVAATWFGPKEVSTACSIAVFGNQLGIAIGFLLPPVIVPDVDDVTELATSLRYMFIGTGVITSIQAILVLIAFEDKPRLPPTVAQKSIIDDETTTKSESYLTSIKQLVTPVPSLLLIITYGVNTGCFYGISTLLNREILTYFPDSVVEAGQVGLVMVLCGIVGSIVCGLILDHTGKYKITTFLVYLSTFVFMGVYTATLSLKQIWIVYLTAGALGFTMTGYLPIGFEFAAELTYPISEGTSSGLLNASAQAFGIALTMGMSAMIDDIDKNGVLWANMLLCGTLLLGTVGTYAINGELKRQNANKQTKYQTGIKVNGSSF